MDNMNIISEVHKREMIKKFCAAFLMAFEYHKNDFVWTNDGVLGTTVIESYIYPFLAKATGLYLIGKLPADGSFYERSAVQEYLISGKGYPSPDSATVVIEHENDHKKSGREMTQLVTWNRHLNILITYFGGSEQKQLDWLSENFAPKIKELKEDANAYLCILPSDHNCDKAKSFREWWCFFVWNKNSQRFEHVLF